MYFVTRASQLFNRISEIPKDFSQSKIITYPEPLSQNFSWKSPLKTLHWEYLEISFLEPVFLFLWESPRIFFFIGNILKLLGFLRGKGLEVYLLTGLDWFLFPLETCVFYNQMKVFLHFKVVERCIFYVLLRFCSKRLKWQKQQVFWSLS